MNVEIFAFFVLIEIIVLMAWRQIHMRNKNTKSNAENEFLKQENEYFRISYADMEKQWMRLRRMRHDMANAYILEMSYLENKQYDILMEYYRDRVSELKKKEEIIHTGNIALDSILNYKLESAKRLQIQVEKTLEIADEIVIGDFDLNILIGNLFDNAMEAVEELSREKRRIQLIVKTDKTAFLFGIKNPYEGKRSKNKAGDFLTGKTDKIYHGLGLREVKRIVKKYKGKLLIEEKEKEFDIKIFVYMN
ncbi:MAG: ATP-binding protein [Suilimivivens sp.]